MGSGADLNEWSHSWMSTSCWKLLSVPCLSGKSVQTSIEFGLGVRTPVCLCLVIRVVIQVVI